MAPMAPHAADATQQATLLRLCRAWAAQQGSTHLVANGNARSPARPIPPLKSADLDAIASLPAPHRIFRTKAPARPAPPGPPNGPLPPPTTPGAAAPPPFSPPPPQTPAPPQSGADDPTVLTTPPDSPTVDALACGTLDLLISSFVRLCPFDDAE